MNVAARRRPASPEALDIRSVVEQPPHRRRHCIGVLGVEQQRGVAGDLGQRRTVRTRHRHPARHRLEDGQPEPLVQRGEHEPVGHRVKALQLRARHPGGEANVVEHSQLAGMLAQPGLVRRRIARQHEHRRLPGALEQHEGVEQPLEVLVGPLGRDAEDHPPADQVVAPAHLFGVERLRLGEPHAAGHDVDALGRDPVQPDEVVAGVRRRGDQPVRAPRRRRYQRPHSERPQPEVRLRHGTEDQVVDRRHAAKRAPQRRGRTHAVDEVAPRPGGHSRHQQLLAEHPGGTVARLDGHGLDPQPVQSGRPHAAELAVDEGRQRRGLRQRLAQPRQQLTGEDLHPARLAGNQEDEVQPDVRRAGRPSGFAHGRQGTQPRTQAGAGARTGRAGRPARSASGPAAAARDRPSRGGSTRR